MKSNNFGVKYHVTKVSNPHKKINALVLEFDDPLAHSAISEWAYRMEREGYVECSNDVRKILSANGFTKENSDFSMSEEEIRKKYLIEAERYFAKKGFKDYCDYSYIEGRIKGREIALIHAEAYLTMYHHLKNELAKHIDVEKFLDENSEETPEGFKYHAELEEKKQDPI